jgi:hypothetical protein
MDNEYLEIACINHIKYVVHGQLNEGTRQVEQLLTEDQKEQVDDLIFKQSEEMFALLRSFVE